MIDEVEDAGQEDVKDGNPRQVSREGKHRRSSWFALCRAPLINVSFDKAFDAVCAEVGFACPLFLGCVVRLCLGDTEG